MPRRSILVIDDERDIQKLLQYNLEKEGYQVHVAKTGEEGLEAAAAKVPDLILLDLMLPGIDGLEVCRLLKAQKNTRHIPVIMLTAKDTDVDQVVGLEMGASDYIAKPFGVKVLLARVKNALRSSGPHKDDKQLLRAGDVVVDRERHTVTLKGKTVPFTKLELKILGFLMENPGKVFSRDQLLSGAWGGESFVVDRTVDVHVRSIRKKLGKSRGLIETVRGTGYRLADDDGA